MKTERSEFSVQSAFKGRTIKGIMYTPVVKAHVKAIFQIAHGMAEHKERYEEFCDFLAQNGYAAVIHDHVGHGESVNSKEELGFFGEVGGRKVLVEDCHSVTTYVKNELGDKPLIFFGHSMGSFIARAYTVTHPEEITAAIYCGTSGANPAAFLAVRIADAVAKSKGSLHRSEFINTLAFGAYNKRIKPARTDFDWLSTDDAQVDKYVADELCGFLFTACGYRDLFLLLRTVSVKKWYKRVPENLPIFLVAGDEDPVGEYGKGVKQVAEDLKKTGHTHVHTKLYRGMRHEILNEVNNEMVMKDILEWSDKQLTKKQ